MSPSKGVFLLKGYTSRMLFLAFPELRRIYKKGSLWSPGKLMGSVGHITLEKAKKYLEDHHAKSCLHRESQLLTRGKKSTEGRSFRTGRTSILSEKVEDFPFLEKFEKKLNRRLQLFRYKSIKNVKNRHLVNNMLNGIVLQGEVKWI